MSAGGHFYPFAAVLSLTIFLSVQSAVSSQADKKQQQQDEAVRILQKLAETRRGLARLRQIVAEFEDDVKNSRKRACSVGGGMSQHCAVAFLDQRMHLRDRLRNGHGPGKRANNWEEDGTSDGTLETNGNKKNEQDDIVNQSVRRYLDHLTRRLDALSELGNVLDAMDSDLIAEQKRTCALNLGGHCSTESAAIAANEWHYLNSPLSPGRKKRFSTGRKKEASDTMRRLYRRS